MKLQHKLINIVLYRMNALFNNLHIVNGVYCAFANWNSCGPVQKQSSICTTWTDAETLSVNNLKSKLKTRYRLPKYSGI